MCQSTRVTIARVGQVQTMDCRAAGGEWCACYCLGYGPQALLRQQQTCAGGRHLGKTLAFRALSQGGCTIHMRIATLITIL